MRSEGGERGRQMSNGGIELGHYYGDVGACAFGKHGPHVSGSVTLLLGKTSQQLGRSKLGWYHSCGVPVFIPYLCCAVLCLYHDDAKPAIINQPKVQLKVTTPF